MNENKEESVLAVGAGVFLGVVGIVIAIWFAGQVLGVVGKWWDGVIEPAKVTQEDRDRWAKQAEEWETSPLNPKVIAANCIKNGGTPIRSAWDGRIKDCRGGDKSVDIEVNQ